MRKPIWIVIKSYLNELHVSDTTDEMKIQFKNITKIQMYYYKHEKFSTVFCTSDYLSWIVILGQHLANIALQLR